MLCGEYASSDIQTGMCWCNTGHAGVIRQLSCRGFHLTDFDGVEDIEHLLMMFDQLHHVNVIPVKSVFCVDSLYLFVRSFV